jgi:hypothetical protein
MRWPLVLTLAGMLTLGACGGGSDGRASGTTTTQPGTPADRRMARAGLLRDGDLPGFQRVASSTSEAADLPSLGVGIKACRSFIDAISIDVVQGRGPGFQRDTNVVNGSDVIYRDDADASAQIEAWRDPGIVTCLQKVYEKQLHRSGLDVSPIAVNDIGDDRFGFRITVPAPSGVQPVTTDVIGVRVGRAVFSLNIVGTAAESAEVQTVVLPKVVDRLRTAGTT